MSRSRASGPPGALFLTGMMGVGKTTVGRLLARRLGWSFRDTDACVEERRGLPVSEIFSRDGEAAFRALERAVLAELPEQGAVVALGGGALVAPENRSLVQLKGTVVWLTAEPATLALRIAPDDSRPLLAGLDAAGREQRLQALLAEREPAYAAAQLRIATDGRSAEQVCAALLAELGWEGAHLAHE